MKFADIMDLTAIAPPDAELVFDDHGRFRALTRIFVEQGKIVFVLEPHADNG